jgi:hypothetical protein
VIDYDGKLVAMITIATSAIACILLVRRSPE